MNFAGGSPSDARRPIRSGTGSSAPKVSICCTTYNHVSFLRDAIEGFLMQEVTFPVEILIHDDASTDGTQDVLREYERRQPGRFEIVYQRENQYSRGIKPMHRFLFPRARGEYIALCEGDDYWTDPLKLEKQVAILESDPDLVLTCGGYRTVGEGQEETVVVEASPASTELHDLEGFTFSLDEMRRAWLTKLLTVLFRNSPTLPEELSVYRSPKDVHVFYHVMRQGRGFYLQSVLGVYRLHTGGVYSPQDEATKKLESYVSYRELYLRNQDDFTRERWLRVTLSLLNYRLYHGVRGKDSRELLRLLHQASRLVRKPGDGVLVLASFMPPKIRRKAAELLRFRGSSKR